MLLVVGCRAIPQAPPSFDSRPFGSFAGSALLCFDLRADRGLSSAGILLRVTPSVPSGRRDIVLSFPTRTVASNRNVLLASGSYEQFTVLSMSMGGPSLGASVIAFTPQARGIDLSKPNLTGLEPGLYFQENGLERWFVLVDNTTEVMSTLKRDFPATSFESYDALAIALPEAAEGREVIRGRTVDPVPSARVGNVVLFARASVVATNRVAVRYVVPPTAAQVAASNSGLKLILVIIIPIFTLLFLDPEDIQRPRLRIAAIWGGVALQVVFIALVVWAAVSVRRPSIEAWADFAIAAVGVVAEVVVVLVKAKTKKPVAG
jgi:hypothetical protein